MSARSNTIIQWLYRELSILFVFLFQYNFYFFCDRQAVTLKSIWQLQKVHSVKSKRSTCIDKLVHLNLQDFSLSRSTDILRIKSTISTQRMAVLVVVTVILSLVFCGGRMNDKKNVCKFDDYIEPRFTGSHCSNPLSKSMSEFKLDKIYPRNINIKLNFDSKENHHAHEHQLLSKTGQHPKAYIDSNSKFYHEYLHLKDQQVKNSFRKNKISQIFNIRSINLIDKNKLQFDEVERIRSRPKHQSKDFKRTQTEKIDKDNLKGLNLIITEKRGSPEQSHKKQTTEKRSTAYFQKCIENKPLSIQKNGDSFDFKLQEYLQYIKQHCQAHGIALKEVENYSRNTITCFVGKGNNGHLIKEAIKKRWWWGINQDKKKNSNFIWTQLKEKSFYCPGEKRPSSALSQHLPKRQESPKNRESIMKQSGVFNQQMHELSLLQIHNHFQNNEFLGNKKALYYSMKAFYQKQGRNVFDYLPVTFHVKRYNDEAWNQFSKYFESDSKMHVGESRLWIVKPGENSNRGNGITIHSDYSKIKELVQSEISWQNNPKKTFIIQKYIDKPFLYNKRKFDIRCYMLLVRLNGSIKGYWYNEGYIRTSCYEYHIEDTSNSFIHLTNDAIQVHCDKYGKYEDGNKLSYHNFQKYLDHNYKNSYKFIEDICPQLKQIATDSIEATYHLLGNWNGLPTFEIFGLDFMIDQAFKPWLIEINTNPCLETSSSTLERVIPRMVDNAFKLSLDLLFPPPSNWQNSKKHFLPNRVNNNLFDLVFDQAKRNSISGMMSDQIIIELGEIEEDNEVFEEKGEVESHLQRREVSPERENVMQ